MAGQGVHPALMAALYPGMPPMPAGSAPWLQGAAPSTSAEAGAAPARDPAEAEAAEMPVPRPSPEAASAAVAAAAAAVAAAKAGAARAAAGAAPVGSISSGIPAVQPAQPASSAHVQPGFPMQPQLVPPPPPAPAAAAVGPPAAVAHILASTKRQRAVVQAAHRTRLATAGGVVRAPAAAAAAAAAAVRPPGAFKPCNCKNSRCLKKYCECFAAGRDCEGCNCVGCMNTTEHEKEREVARQVILRRDPAAFQPKVAQQRGCNCKKSGCMKKYCECFHAGIPCSAACNCKGCKNCVPGGRRMQALQAVVRAPVGSRSQQRLSSEGSPLESSQLQSDAAVSGGNWQLQHEEEEEEGQEEGEEEESQQERYKRARREVDYEGMVMEALQLMPGMEGTGSAICDFIAKSHWAPQLDWENLPGRRVLRWKQGVRSALYSSSAFVRTGAKQGAELVWRLSRAVVASQHMQQPEEAAGLLTQPSTDASEGSRGTAPTSQLQLAGRDGIRPAVQLAQRDMPAAWQAAPVPGPHMLPTASLHGFPSALPQPAAGAAQQPQQRQQQQQRPQQWESPPQEAGLSWDDITPAPLGKQQGQQRQLQQQPGVATPAVVSSGAGALMVSPPGTAGSPRGLTLDQTCLASVQQLQAALSSEHGPVQSLCLRWSSEPRSAAPTSGSAGDSAATAATAAIEGQAQRQGQRQTSLPALLGCLEPEALHELHLDLWDDSSLGQLDGIRHLTGLTALSLARPPAAAASSGSGPEPLSSSASLAWLAQLRALRSLDMPDIALSRQGISALSRLTGLTLLRLGVGPKGCVALPGTLSRLTQLQHLCLHFAPECRWELGPGCLEQLQCLTALDVHQPWAGEEEAGRQRALQGLSMLGALRVLRLRHGVEFAAEDLYQCRQLARLSLGREAAWAFLDCPPPPGSLPSLQALSFHAKWLEGSAFPGGAFPPELCQLGVTAMGLVGEGTPRLELPPAFAGFSKLEVLDLSNNGLLELPACVAELGSLRRLNLGENKLSSLPDGPYLANLQVLGLQGNEFRRFPQVLAKATQLERLHMPNNMLLQLESGELESAISALPRLQTLSLGKALAADGAPVWDKDSWQAVQQASRRFPGVIEATVKAA